MIAISAAGAMVAYALYTVDAQTIATQGTDRLVYTVPFVLYGLFRYLHVLYRGRGCGQCNDTGYKGRTGIFEVLAIDDTIRMLLVAKAPFEQILDAARKQGMRSLRDDGLEKALAGITTIEEVIRVTEARRLVEQDIEKDLS